MGKSRKILRVFVWVDKRNVDRLTHKITHIDSSFSESKLSVETQELVGFSVTDGTF